MTEQRRAHRRFALCLAAEIAHGEQEFTATTRNVSRGGCCVESAYRLAEGAEIGIALYLVVDGIEDAEMPSMALRGAIQWTAEADDAAADARHVAGVRFLDITADQQSWLEGILQRTENQ